MTNVFGFSTETKSGGDFLPILIRCPRRAFLRVDRGNDGTGFSNTNVDITDIFKAVCDFDNVEIGWLSFQPGQAPSMVLVPYGQKMPDKPSDLHKEGVRFMVKLSKECAGTDGKAVREVAANSKAFTSGLESVYMEYLKDRTSNKGKLPVLVLERKAGALSRPAAGSSRPPTTTPSSRSLDGWSAVICCIHRR